MWDKTNKAHQFSLILVALVALVAPAWVAIAHVQSGSVDDVVQEIMKAQSVTNQKDINCQAVSDEQFEELGDAAMGTMVFGDQQHEAMDDMMGGEGSESLRAMHIGMGQRYLNCAQGQFGTGGMMNMMVSDGQREGGSMMGNYYGRSGMMGGSWRVDRWLVVIGVILALVVWLMRRRTDSFRRNDSLDILKVRYAKGEISKEEFKERKMNLIA